MPHVWYNLGMIKMDNLHYNYDEINGYNKPYNFIMSPREPGKTSMAWMKLIYLKWKKDKKPWMYLVRQVVEITEALIESIQDTIINKFTDDAVKFEFKRKFDDGIVDVKINGEMFFRIVSLSITMRRIKLAVLANIGGVLMDEYIIDPQTGEKYISNEAFKIKEAYTTWKREYTGKGVLKCYFLGNPYSLYNPLFMDWGVNPNLLKRDSFYAGDRFVIHWAVLNPELKKKLIAENPLYQFDEEYSNYALEGQAINDANIKLATLPEYFHIRYAFKVNNRFLAVFKANFLDINRNFSYFVKEYPDLSKKRIVFCYDFKELVDKAIIMSPEDRFNLSSFKDAIRKNNVAYEDINVYYLIMEVYKNL